MCCASRTTWTSVSRPDLTAIPGAGCEHVSRGSRTSTPPRMAGFLFVRIEDTSTSSYSADSALPSPLRRGWGWGSTQPVCLWTASESGLRSRLMTCPNPLCPACREKSPRATLLVGHLATNSSGARTTPTPPRKGEGSPPPLRREPGSRGKTSPSPVLTTNKAGVRERRRWTSSRCQPRCSSVRPPKLIQPCLRDLATHSARALFESHRPLLK